MQANEITKARLRQLAGIRTTHGKVLSLYLNLDPSEFATPRARSSEITSVLNRAERMAADGDGLTHDEREALKADLQRVRTFLEGAVDFQGAHGVAIFCSTAAGLFEVIKLPRPVSDEAVVNNAPYVEPLVRIGAQERWCVLLVNRHVGRILCGSREDLEEVERIVAERTQGADLGDKPLPQNEPHTLDHDTELHFKRMSKVMLERVGGDALDGLLIGAPQELWRGLEQRLHPDVRKHFCGRVEVDIERGSVAEVLAATQPVIAAVAKRREDELLERLAERTGIGERAASGLVAVLDAVTAQRVEALLVDDGLAAAGRRCPHCGLLALPDVARCPADGTEMLDEEDVVETAVERAISQSADVHVLRDRPELDAYGGIAALLRF